MDTTHGAPPSQLHRQDQVLRRSLTGLTVWLGDLNMVRIRPHLVRVLPSFFFIFITAAPSQPVTQAATASHSKEHSLTPAPAVNVSAYATMHPWEDWAETFAHYLHIRDTLQTAAAFGIRIENRDKALSANPAVDVDDKSFESILADWLPLSYALNAVNRSMGKDDLYPFLLNPPVIEKLTWVHTVWRGDSPTPRTSPEVEGPERQREARV